MMEQIRKNNSLNNGFVALTAVILINAVIGMIIVSISVQTIDESQIALAFEKSKQAKFDSLACSEKILLELSNDTDFSPTGPYIINTIGTDKITCATTTLTDNPDGSKTLRVEVEDDFTSKLEVEIATTTPEIKIDQFNFVD